MPVVPPYPKAQDGGHVNPVQFITRFTSSGLVEHQTSESHYVDNLK